MSRPSPPPAPVTAAVGLFALATTTSFTTLTTIVFPSSKHRLNSIVRLVEKRFPWPDMIVLEVRGSKLMETNPHDRHARNHALQTVIIYSSLHLVTFPQLSPYTGL